MNCHFCQSTRYYYLKFDIIQNLYYGKSQQMVVLLSYILIPSISTIKYYVPQHSALPLVDKIWPYHCIKVLSGLQTPPFSLDFFKVNVQTCFSLLISFCKQCYIHYISGSYSQNLEFRSHYDSKLTSAMHVVSFHLFGIVAWYNVSVVVKWNSYLLKKAAYGLLFSLTAMRNIFIPSIRV